jgi:hypothetical protein
VPVGLRDLYRHHIAAEDNEIFPAAAATLSTPDCRATGDEMVSRRGNGAKHDENPAPRFQESLQLCHVLQPTSGCAVILPGQHPRRPQNVRRRLRIDLDGGIGFNVFLSIAAVVCNCSCREIDTVTNNAGAP